MTNVTGFLVRTSLSDTGTLPRSGPWTGCPDIIPAGITAMSQNDLVSSYGRAINQTLTQGLQNFLYLRAKNMNATPLTQTAWMFQVPGSLVLRPEVWFSATNLVGFDVRVDGTGTPDNPTIIKKYGQPITAAPGQIGVTNAYTWKPETTEHHCLVGVIANSWDDVLSDYPSNPVNSLDDLAQWIYANGSIGWHNVDIQPLTSRIYEGQVAYSNTDRVDEKVTFTMIAQNVPVGAKISFSSNSSTSSGEVIGQDWTTVPAPPSGANINPDFEVGTTINVNADYKTIITYRTDFNGTTPPGNFAMHVKASVPLTPPAAKNAAMANFLATDSFARSYYRSYSPSAVFNHSSGATFGQGIDGYRTMLAAMWGPPGGGGGDIGNQAIVVVGSHTTQPSST